MPKKATHKSTLSISLAKHPALKRALVEEYGNRPTEGFQSWAAEKLVVFATDAMGPVIEEYQQKIAEANARREAAQVANVSVEARVSGLTPTQRTAGMTVEQLKAALLAAQKK
jgi:hypothetical protein